MSAYVVLGPNSEFESFILIPGVLDMVQHCVSLQNKRMPMGRTAPFNVRLNMSIISYHLLLLWGPQSTSHFPLILFKFCIIKGNHILVGLFHFNVSCRNMFQRLHNLGGGILAPPRNQLASQKTAGRGHRDFWVPIGTLFCNGSSFCFVSQKALDDKLNKAR